MGPDLTFAQADMDINHWSYIGPGLVHQRSFERPGKVHTYSVTLFECLFHHDK